MQVSEVLQQCGAVFARVQAAGAASAAEAVWTLAAGVALPPPLRPATHEDYSVHDTPPGQKVPTL